MKKHALFARPAIPASIPPQLITSSAGTSPRQAVDRVGGVPSNVEKLTGHPQNDGPANDSRFLATGSILRLPAVLRKVGISRTGLYERISRGEFPKQVQLGPKAVGWLDYEVDTWLADRIAASRSTEGGLQ